MRPRYWRIGTALDTYPTDVVTVALDTRQQFRDIAHRSGQAARSMAGFACPVQGALQNLAEFERGIV